MKQEQETKARQQTPLWQCIVLVVVLYMLQGVTLALLEMIPLYLASFDATWTQQGTLSLAMYPFTLKLLWAPLVDVFYVRWLGRRQTWLLPVLVLLGVMFIVLSFYFERLLAQVRVTELTIIFLIIIFFTATQDICVDGWALTLFSSSNVVWQSISQTIGQPLGAFLGSPILLTFESANMTNMLIRQPLGLALKPHGLFTLGQFLRFWGFSFFVVTAAILLLFRKERRLGNSVSSDGEETDLKLIDAYLYIVRLFKKKCFRQSILILIGPHIGYAATSAMTFVVLISQGLIRRETVGLITMPLILIKSTAPLFLSKTHRPLIIYAQSYIPRLILCALIAVFVFYSARLKANPVLFYSILLALLSVNDALVYVQGAARGGFFAYISDTRIGSTYYTLLAALNNIGLTLSTTAVLHSANWLPKGKAYFIEVGVCLLLGLVWLCFSWRLMYRLQTLPTERWHLKPKVRTIDGDPTTKDPSTEQSAIVANNTALLPFL